MKLNRLLIMMIAVTWFLWLDADAADRLFLLPDQNSYQSKAQDWSDKLPEAVEIRNLLQHQHLDESGRLARWLVIELAENTDTDRIINRLSADPAVEIVEKAPVRSLFDASLDGLPDDPLAIFQWHLEAIDAFAAWDIVYDASDITIGIPDLGVWLEHPDIVASLWTNETEAGGSPGVDDDGNGFIDDIHGWDAYDRDGDPSPSSADVKHGTHVAGIAAATHNNSTGVSGIAPNAKIMALRIGDSSSFETGPDADAIIYAVDNGVDIISMSYGGSQGSMLEQDVMRYAAANGVVLVAASGNDHWFFETYPAAYEDVISVAGTNADDRIFSASNFGWWVDVAAPGVGIFSTMPNGYGYDTGTSMACPIVAGIAALIMANEPGLAPEQVRARIAQGSEPILELPAGFVLNGRVNAYRSLLASKPSVALDDVRFSDQNSNGVIEPGESFDVTLDLDLFGGDAGHIMARLFGIDTLVTGEDLQSWAYLSPGLFSSEPLHAMTSGSTERGSYPLGLELTIDDRKDSLTFQVPVDPPWRTHDAGDMCITITDFGAIGYWDYVNERETPDGVKLDNQVRGLLFHGSVMVYNGDGNSVSDCAYGTVLTDRYDFSTQSGGEIRRIESEDDSEAYLAVYSDDRVRITQTTTSYPDDESFLIIDLQLENLLPQEYQMLAGIYCDWDINPHTQNEVLYNSELSLSYMRGPSASAGMLAVSDQSIAGVSAIDNETYVYNGFSDQDKLIFMTGGTDQAESPGPGEWSHLITLNMGEVESGATVQARFAIVAAETEAELFTAAQRAISVSEKIPAPSGSNESGIPADFRLPAPYPNPFNSSVNIDVELPREGVLNLGIFDILGRKVVTLYDGEINAGQRSFYWNGTGIDGRDIASGIYLLRASWQDRNLCRKVLLLK